LVVRAWGKSEWTRFHAHTPTIICLGAVNGRKMTSRNAFVAGSARCLRW